MHWIWKALIIVSLLASMHENVHYPLPTLLPNYTVTIGDLHERLQIVENKLNSR